MAATIRPALPEDAAALLRLIQAFNQEESGRASPLTAALLDEVLFGPAPRFAVQLADQAGALVGYAAFFPSYDTDHAAKGFYLQDLFVAPAARGQGIGRALLAAVATACLDQGGQYMFWNALERNRAGRAFYRAIGAREQPVVTLALRPAELRALAKRRDGD